MIKIRKLVESSQYKIYCDMDSVLTDFDKAFLEIADVKTKDGWEYKKKFGRDKFQQIIDSKGITFWTQMPWMPNGKMLWNYINTQFDDVSILSAPSSHDKGESKRGKLIWCKYNLRPIPKIIIEEDKWKYAAPNSILIDDLEKNITPWKARGGIGILHKSTIKTIRQLNGLIY